MGVTEGTIRHAIRRGELTRAAAAAPAPIGPRERSDRARQASGGIAVQRHAERVLARLGQLREAAPRFVAAEAVRYGGVLVALPALLSLGLLDAGEQSYGTLKNAFYGLRSTLLILAFMALYLVDARSISQAHNPNHADAACERYSARLPLRYFFMPLPIR